MLGAMPEAPGLRVRLALPSLTHGAQEQPKATQRKRLTPPHPPVSCPGLQLLLRRALLDGLGVGSTPRTAGGTAGQRRVSPSVVLRQLRLPAPFCTTLGSPLDGAAGTDPIKNVAKEQRKPSPRLSPQAGSPGPRGLPSLRGPAEGAAALLTAGLCCSALVPGLVPWPPVPILGFALWSLVHWFLGHRWQLEPRLGRD